MTLYKRLHRSITNSKMKIVFIWLAVTIHSMSSEKCEILNGKARTYYSSWGRPRTTCYGILPPEIKCNYSRMGNYPDTNELCHRDHLRLHFYSDRITVLPSSAFITNFKVSELYLEDLGITKITPGAFNHQSSIKSIFLSKNNLSQIGDGIFNSLMQLEVLDLSENEISNISEDAFSSAPLKQLNVSYNNISSIPDSLAAVQVLDISHNCIKSISSKIFTTITLNISSNIIDRINLSHFPNISKLYMADNKLTTLPEDLKDLEVLNVGGNRISNLPSSALVATNLQKLILSNNSISKIPVQYFGKLKRLETLDLSKNNLSEFAFGTFDALKSLNSLNISYNKFKALPIYVFHLLKGLNKLYFSDNSLTEVKVDDLRKYLPNLGMVDMRNNALACNNLLEVCHNLQKDNVSFEHGSFAGGNNIYGMNCIAHNDSINIKEKSKSPEVNETYAALQNYFNKEFRNSNFVQYLENLRNVGNKTENSNLLSNLTDILTDIKQLINELVKTDKAQANEKPVIKINQTNAQNDVPHQTLANYLNVMENVLKSLKQIVNYTEVTDVSHDKELSGIGLNITQELYGMSSNQGQILEMLKEIRGGLKLMPLLNQHSKDLEQQQTKSEVAELRSSAENAPTKGYTSILTFIAVLLTIIVGLMLVHGYIVFSRIKHVDRPKSDVELARLVESKPDTVNS